MIIFLAGSIKAQGSRIWVKFNSATDVPICDGQTCSHADQAFENYLNSLGVDRVSLALPAIVDFPQAGAYGLDLVYEVFVDSVDATNILDSLSSFAFIDYAESVEEYESYLYTPDDYDLLDPIHGANWQLDLIEAENAWDISKDAGSTVIAINESGNIQSDHEDLEGLVTNASSNNFNYHKTHVAGCSTANNDNAVGLSSIGYGARLYDGILGSFSQGYTNALLTSSEANVDIINLSVKWGCSHLETTQSVINMLTDDGLIIVAAAGNGNIGNSCTDPNGYVFPASYDNVISVSSVGENNEHFRPGNNNPGSHTHNDKVDICAPGYSVLSTELGGGYTRSSGTSMASPMTAGVIALLLNINPCLEHDDILSIIQSTADPVDDAADFPANSLGAGRINAYEACLAAMQTTDLPNPIITSNQLISNSIIVGQDIIIESGFTLTVTGTIKMSPGKKIIVKPGAKLELDGGTLTNSDCRDKMWQGIEIHGNLNLPQTTSNQGVVVTKNNAVISNAREALSFIEPGNWNSRGGIAWCKDTDFINNKRSAQFIAYSDPNNPNLDYKSYFIRCEFIYDDQTALPEAETAPFAQVTLWGVKGVDFLGCSFENNATVDVSEDRSKGIFSIDASYRVSDYCSVPIVVGGTCPTNNLTESKFMGYNTAIHPQGAVGLNGVRIFDTSFDENLVGVFLDEANYSTVVKNEFSVGLHPYEAILGDNEVDDAIYHTGIITEGLSDFIIEQNNLSGDNTYTDFTHGVVVQDGEGSPLAVYNNELIDLGSGVIGAGVNDDHLTENGAGEYGLRFICNKNLNNSNDIEVRGVVTSLSDGFIDDTQSGFNNVGQASGNTFSAADGFNSNFVHMDFKSNKTYFYRYDNAASDQIPNADEVNIEPSATAEIYAEIATSSNNCPLNFDDGPVKEVLKFDFQVQKSEFYNLLYTYHQFIDQGNTAGVLNDIADTWPSEAWDLRDDLVARSPYNSDTVLIAAADRNILPHGMLLEVLVLNPEALRNGNVIGHVKCCIPNPMPQYMIDILIASKSAKTARSLLEHNLSNLRQKMAMNNRMVLDLMIADTAGVASDSLRKWVGQMTHLEGRYNLVSYYLGRKEYGLAREAMDSLQVQVKLTSKSNQELTAMRQFTSFLETVSASGRTLAQLNETERTWLLNLANNPESGTAGARAENILCFFHNICSPPSSVPKSDIHSLRNPKPSSEELISEQNRIILSPNPSNYYVQVEYLLLFEKQRTTLNIYDQVGKKLSSTSLDNRKDGVMVIDTRKFANGLYFVEIVQDDKPVSTEKFIVQH